MTEGPRKGVSVIVQKDGALQSQTYRVPAWLLRAALVLAVAFAVLLILGVTYYAPVARQAARVPALEREIDQLRTDNLRVRELAAAVDSLGANYERLRAMVGADVVPDPIVIGSPFPVAPAVVARLPGAPPRYEAGLSLPTHWPLDEAGFVTRGQAVADSAEERHPGMDVAVPVGTLVRASGGGVVVQAGEHEEYGLYVLLEHPDGYQTQYGHLSRVLTAAGANVAAGEVIGRSGNTGRSSAPHLHFEIRRNGVPVDPGTLLKEIP